MRKVMREGGREGGRRQMKNKGTTLTQIHDDGIDNFMKEMLVFSP